jgi:hypothetical protein
VAAKNSEERGASVPERGLVRGQPGQVVSVAIDAIVQAAAAHVDKSLGHLADMLGSEVMGYSIHADPAFRDEVVDGLRRVLPLGAALLQHPRPLTPGERVVVSTRCGQPSGWFGMQRGPSPWPRPRG